MGSASFLRNGAVRLIEQAVAAEFEEFLERYREGRDEHGRGAVVTNGYRPERTILTGVDAVAVKAPVRGCTPLAMRSPDRGLESRPISVIR
jgi:hypothetical protein